MRSNFPPFTRGPFPRPFIGFLHFPPIAFFLGFRLTYFWGVFFFFLVPPLTHPFFFLPVTIPLELADSQAFPP